MVEHNIMLTFNLTIAEVCNLEIYIAYFMDIKLFSIIAYTYLLSFWRFLAYFYNGGGG